MPFSVFEITVPVMQQGLSVMSDYLHRAKAFEEQHGHEEGSVLRTKLAPDMLNFGEQIAVNCNKIDAHMAKLLQRDAPTSVATAETYSSLKTRIDQTTTLLEQVDRDEIAGAESHTFELNPPLVRGWFAGDEYIRHIVLPDFFFHISMLHAILRHLGAPVGKRDYLGNLSGRSGGYS